MFPSSLDPASRRVIALVVICLSLSISLPLAAGGPGDPVLEQTLHAISPAPLDRYGYALAQQGDRLLVGAENLAGAGSAYLHEFNAGVWGAGTPVEAPDIQPEDLYGGSVALDGDRLVVGAPGRTVDGFAGAGMVYIFEDAQATVIEIAAPALDTKTDFIGDNFGHAVAISGDTLVVGVPNRGVKGNCTPGGETIPGKDCEASGGVYVFDRIAGVWQFSQFMSTHKYHDNVGQDVDIDGDRLAIGIASDDAEKRGSGRVDVYARVDGTWVLEAMLKQADPAFKVHAGWSIDLLGDTLVTGAVRPKYFNGSEHGAAYVWERDPTGTWTQAAKLTPTDLVFTRRFGESVALSDDGAGGQVLVVGAPWTTEGDGKKTGAAFFYRRPETGWIDAVEDFRIQGVSGLGAGAEFGWSVGSGLTSDGLRVGVGVPCDLDPGAVEIYQY